MTDSNTEEQLFTLTSKTTLPGVMCTVTNSLEENLDALIIWNLTDGELAYVRGIGGTTKLKGHASTKFMMLNWAAGNPTQHLNLAGAPNCKSLFLVLRTGQDLKITKNLRMYASSSHDDRLASVRTCDYFINSDKSDSGVMFVLSGCETSNPIVFTLARDYAFFVYNIQLQMRRSSYHVPAENDPTKLLELASKFPSYCYRGFFEEVGSHVLKTAKKSRVMCQQIPYKEQALWESEE